MHYSRAYNSCDGSFVCPVSWVKYQSGTQSERDTNDTSLGRFYVTVTPGAPITPAIWYTQQEGRSAAVHVRIKQGQTVLIDRVIDQTKTPAENAAALGLATVNGTDPTTGDPNAKSSDGTPQTFMVLGTVTPTADTITVEYQGDGLGYVIADMLLATSDSDIPPPVLVRPAKVGAARISPGGKILALFFADLDSNDAILHSLDTTKPILASINGGAPITLPTTVGNVVWEPGYQSDPQSYAAFPLPVALSRGDTLTITVQDSFATTDQGVCAPATDLAADNLVGTSFLPLWVSGTQTMGVGTNITTATSTMPVMMFSDLSRQLGDWVDNSGAYDFQADEAGNITAMGSYGNIGAGLIQPIDNPGKAGANYKACGPGRFTLRYSGTATPQLYPATDNTTKTIIGTSTDGQGVTTLTYDFGATDPDLGVAVALLVQGAPGTSCILHGIFPPNPADPANRSLDGSTIFHPHFLRMLAGYRSLRFMDALGTNDSNVVEFADFNTTASLSFGRVANRQIIPRIAAVGPYDNADHFFQDGGAIPVLITTTQPHGLSEGQFVSFYGLQGPSEPGPSYSGIFPVANPAGTITLNNAQSLVHVKSPTTFAVRIGTDVVGAVAGQGLSQTYANVGTRAQALCQTRIGWSPELCIALCNAIGADLWLNFPHAGTDACATELAQLVAANLAAGLKCRLEYSNETWNWSFLQNGYCIEMGGAAGLGPDQWYVLRAGQVQALAQAAFDAAGRGQDLIRIIGTQHGDPGGVGKTRVDYATANNIPFHGLASAPYFWSGPANDALGDVYTPMVQSQRMDVAELFTGGPQIDNLMAANYALVSALPGNITIQCYEGGCEFGGLVGTGDRGAWSRAWARDPRMRGIYLHYMTTLQSNGATIFHDYQLCSNVASVDFVANSAMYPKYVAYDQLDGLGDGSDGLFDNRTDYEALGRIVSVAGHAIKEWNGAVQANPGGGQPPGPRHRARPVASRRCNPNDRRAPYRLRNAA